jgi:hypothetical protein
MFALVLDIDVPVPVLNEDGYVLMAQIPSDIIVVFLVFRRLYRQREISAAEPGTFITLVLFGHHKLQTVNG